MGFGVAAVGGTPAAAEIPNPYVFSSADVGFIEGGVDVQRRVDLIPVMDEYVGDKKPIIRIDLGWNFIQSCATCPVDWTELDRSVDAAYAQGMRVLLILGYAPSWANGGRKFNYFPTDDAAWASIVDAAVAHFGPKVQAYEVWNEPNLEHFGNYGDNSVDVRAGRYWELVKIAYQRVHAACADCVVVAGGSAYGDVYDARQSRNDNEARDWLEWAYKHNMRGYFDAVAYHPYPDIRGGHLPSYAMIPCTAPHWYRWWSGFGPDDPQCGGLAALRAVMVQYGDSAKKIWGTEFGFPTSGSREPQSREHVRDALEEGVRTWRSRDYTGPLFIYSFQDLQRSFPHCVKNPADGECHFGLRDAEGRPKEPIYSDVRAALIGNDFLNSLSPGRSLFRGTAMRSSDGKYWLWMQTDGNLVIYQVVGGRQTVLWGQGDKRAYRLSNQHDGNLVLYDQADNVLWSSRTKGKGDSTLWMQEDGNLVLYAHQPLPVKPTWASNTVRP
ncbi:hypothetical protein AB0M36_04290 [Actinoplanes sp. NPDC051346]|uniref:hypothetical protein n=1 Tax=Actinoplanes sp. NPDC051346 TaxID=3155048 RepID=UPI00341C6AFC